MQERLIHNFELRFPFMTDKVVKYHERGNLELIIELENGDVALYDDLAKTMRILPTDDELLVEDNFTKEFSRRLSSVLYHKGMTQKELSNLTGIPQPMIARYINNRAVPSLYKVNKMARVLGCSIDELWP